MTSLEGYKPFEMSRHTWWVSHWTRPIIVVYNVKWFVDIMEYLRLICVSGLYWALLCFCNWELIHCKVPPRETGSPLGRRICSGYETSNTIYKISTDVWHFEFRWVTYFSLIENLAGKQRKQLEWYSILYMLYWGRFSRNRGVRTKKI
jgi:hypothetical protein